MSVFVESPQFASMSIDAVHYKIIEIMKGFPSSGKVLDFPCGSGRLSYWLQQMGFDVVSCDIKKHANVITPYVYGNLDNPFPFDDN